MGRIRGEAVPALFPTRGPIRVFLVGEAPGPRGADQSGIPFWGDRAGKVVYRVLAAAGLATVPSAAWETWDGTTLIERGLQPELHRVALSNAYPRCPTSDGDSFRAPTNRELNSPENRSLLTADLRRVAEHCPGPLRVVVLGSRARWLLEQLAKEFAPPLELHSLPHPSAQGLLQAAPHQGKGLKLSDLETAWAVQLRRCLRQDDP